MPLKPRNPIRCSSGMKLQNQSLCTHSLYYTSPYSPITFHAESVICIPFPVLSKNHVFPVFQLYWSILEVFLAFFWYSNISLLVVLFLRYIQTTRFTFKVSVVPQSLNSFTHRNLTPPPTLLTQYRFFSRCVLPASIQRMAGAQSRWLQPAWLWLDAGFCNPVTLECRFPVVKTTRGKNNIPLIASDIFNTSELMQMDCWWQSATTYLRDDCVCTWSLTKTSAINKNLTKLN